MRNYFSTLFIYILLAFQLKVNGLSPYFSQKSVGDAKAGSVTTSSNDFNLLYYQGGNGPYFKSLGYGISRDPPQNCEVNHVQVVS